MSHLAHIVEFKKSLITEGITNPDLQIQLVRTAYVKALITVGNANKLDKQQCIDFNRFVLGYWNETTPVNGLAVAAAVGAFYRKLEGFLNNTFTDNELNIDIVDKVELPLEVKYTELETYRNLVQTLVDEANHKLPQYIEVAQVI